MRYKTAVVEENLLFIGKLHCALPEQVCSLLRLIRNFRSHFPADRWVAQTFRSAMPECFAEALYSHPACRVFATSPPASCSLSPRALAAAKSAAQKAIIQRQIDATDAEIDRLVYDLYPSPDGTAEEIALVEGQE